MKLALNFSRVDPDRGGAETYIVDLCQRLVAAGHEVALYAHEWREAVLPPEVACHRVAISGRTRAARLWSFAQNSEALLREARHDCSIGFINTWRHDIIIPQGGVHPASLEYNARRFPAGWRRRLYLLGKRLNPMAGLYEAIERMQYDPARRAWVVAVSAMVRGHLERFHGVPRERIRVIPNAIDASRLDVPDPAASRREFRDRLGLDADDLIALFVGHNYRLKGLAPLIDALALRRSRTPTSRPIHLVACGGGDPAPFQRQARRLGLQQTTHLVGFLPSVKEAYWAADCFVLPSYYDPCSLVVLEALACGLPVITTACNGAGELITPGQEGFVIPSPDSRADLAEALGRLTNDATRHAMSVDAARLGRRQSLDQHVGRLLELCEEVAHSKRSTARPRVRLRADHHVAT